MNNEKLLQSGVNGFFWMTGMTVVSYAIQIVMTAMLARLLTKPDFGEVAAIQILAGFSEIIWMLGIGPAVVQKKILEQEDIVTAHTLNAVFGILVFIILNLFNSFFCSVFFINNSQMLRIFSIIILFNSFCAISQSLCQRDLKFKHISIIRTISLFCYAVLAIILAFNNWGVWSLIAGLIFQAMITAVLFLIISPVKCLFHINKNSAKNMLRFGIGFSIARILNYTATSCDNYIVNMKLGKSLLGVYSKAYQLLLYPVSLIGETMDQVLFPIFSKTQDNHDALKDNFLNGTTVIALISAPISVIAFFRAYDLVLLLFGDQWLDIVIPFQIFVCGLFFRTAYKLSDSLIRAIGKMYYRAGIQACYVILVVIGAYYGSSFGLPGVSFGVTFAFVCNYFLITGFAISNINISAKHVVAAISPALILFFTLLPFGILYGHIITISSAFWNCVLFSLMIFIIAGGALLILKKIIFNDVQRQFISHLGRTLYSILKNIWVRTEGL